MTNDRQPVSFRYIAMDTIFCVFTIAYVITTIGIEDGPACWMKTKKLQGRNNNQKYKTLTSVATII